MGDLPHPDPLRLDHDRERRCGFPEVIYGEGKAPEDVEQAARAILERSGRLLVTRLEATVGESLAKELPEGRYHRRARCLTARTRPVTPRGRVEILCAGTSDVPVAEEARVTAEMAGSRVVAHYDVGVAGLHRVLALEEELHQTRVVVVVAGMEGALPSVVAGLTPRPVIAVPTSVGYGTSFGGLTPLLGMLNSCAAGVSVVNIDNGFGAGLLASKINLLPPWEGPDVEGAEQ